MAAIVQTLNEIDDDEEDVKIELPPDKLVWMGCAVSGLMAVFTATVALCTVNEATKSRSVSQLHVTVIIGYCDTVGEWQCINIRMLKLSH